MTVTVYNTVGSNEKTVQFDGSTWGELQSVLRAEAVPFEGMAAIIGESQLTLDSLQALTPTGDWTLFLLPVEVKSGNDDDASFDDEDNYDDDDDVDVAPTSMIAPETQLMITQIKQTINQLNAVIETLEGRVITDPRILDLAATARTLMANRRG